MTGSAVCKEQGEETPVSPRKGVSEMEEAVPWGSVLPSPQ